LILEPCIHRRNPSKRKIQCLLGQHPEIEVATRKRQRPGVFELLGAPDFRHSVRVGPHGGAVARDRGVDIKQRSVRVEHEDWHGGLRHCADRRSTSPDMARAQFQGTLTKR
jgi:hypothetical protein